MKSILCDLVHLIYMGGVGGGGGGGGGGYKDHVFFWRLPFVIGVFRRGLGVEDIFK